ncbi:B12-binding domain-containing radical SAM protein [bacterium]|nr:B12-binding domain-containing radical SAM protein [bacterium]
MKNDAPAIALIYPPTNAVTVMPSLGIGYLASAARRAGYGVRLFDLARRHLRLKDVFRILAEERPKYIGLSISTPNYANARKIAALIRKLPYKPTVLLGGPHVSVYPEEALADFGGHYVLVREAEESMVRLLDALEAGRDPAEVQGVTFRPNGHCVSTGVPPINEDLDSFAWPAWDLIEPQKYPPVPHQLFVRQLPVAPVITTRGCPFDCNYCASTFLFGKKIRRRDAKDVVDEMFHLVDRYGVREIHIEDDNPTLIRPHIDALCDELLARDRPISWKFPNGIMVKTADEDLLRLMKSAGCYQISLGIETLNEETVIGKDVPVGRIPEITRIAREIGLQTTGFFVLGLPGESDAMVLHTLRESMKLGLDFAHFGIYVPLPGSRWGEAERIDAGADAATSARTFSEIVSRGASAAKAATGIGNGAVASGNWIANGNGTTTQSSILNPQSSTSPAPPARLSEYLYSDGKSHSSGIASISPFEGFNFFTATQRDKDEAKKLKSYQRRAVLRFYTRPRTMLTLARTLKARQIPGFLHTFRRYVFA